MTCGPLKGLVRGLRLCTAAAAYWSGSALREAPTARLPVTRGSAPAPSSSPASEETAGVRGSELVCWPAFAALSLEPSRTNTQRRHSCD
ncbi:hypothetical protein NDU88_008572 [Pleurodeles waltl]|uniref:Secreted protein n=1 Tax=Pleurodeles waltl TaxID=8319 RepID=A0AAV7RTH3_PLEWA|nr:hypothetical protein NDU88_008572 [Pleurodeles waltl]